MTGSINGWIVTFTDPDGTKEVLNEGQVLAVTPDHAR